MPKFLDKYIAKKAIKSLVRLGSTTSIKNASDTKRLQDRRFSGSDSSIMILGANPFYAVKIPKSNNELAKNELKTLEKLSALKATVPYLIKFLGHKRIFRKTAIVMQNGGKDLRQYVRPNVKGPRGISLFLQEIRTIFSKLLKSMAALPENVAYSDIKPDNILFSVNEASGKVDDVTVIDVARTVEFKPTKGIVVGYGTQKKINDRYLPTPSYRAPEQLDPKKDISKNAQLRKSDMFSLGLTALSLLFMADEQLNKPIKNYDFFALNDKVLASGNQKINVALHGLQLEKLQAIQLDKPPNPDEQPANNKELAEKARCFRKNNTKQILQRLNPQNMEKTFHFNEEDVLASDEMHEFLKFVLLTLQFNPENRIAAEQALDLPFFKSNPSSGIAPTPVYEGFDESVVMHCVSSL